MTAPSQTTRTMTATITSGHILVDAGTSLVFEGTIDGTIEVPAGSHLTLNGSLRGSLQVSAGATAEIAPAGAVDGALCIDGALRNAGTRTRAWSGQGEVTDLEGSTVR